MSAAKSLVPGDPLAWSVVKMTGTVEIVAGLAEQEQGYARFVSSICRMEDTDDDPDDPDGIMETQPSLARAERIVLCVNAMAGLSASDVQALRGQLAAAKKALEFYANPKNWGEDGCGRWEVPGVVWTHDDGDTAREALQQLGGAS